MKSIEENSLAVVYLYQTVKKSRGDGCPSKVCSDNLPEGIVHKAWIFLRERFTNSDALSESELREDMSKIKLKENENPADFSKEIAKILNQ